MRESKNLTMLSHWEPGICCGALPGDLDDFPACRAFGALNIIVMKKRNKYLLLIIHILEKSISHILQ